MSDAAASEEISSFPDTDISLFSAGTISIRSLPFAFPSASPEVPSVLPEIFSVSPEASSVESSEGLSSDAVTIIFAESWIVLPT